MIFFYLLLRDIYTVSFSPDIGSDGLLSQRRPIIQTLEVMRPNLRLRCENIIIDCVPELAHNLAND